MTEPVEGPPGPPQLNARAAVRCSALLGVACIVGLLLFEFLCEGANLAWSRTILEVISHTGADECLNRLQKAVGYHVVTGATDGKLPCVKLRNVFGNKETNLSQHSESLQPVNAVGIGLKNVLSQNVQIVPEGARRCVERRQECVEIAQELSKRIIV